MVNPIIDWSDDEVWEFIHEYNVPYCGLYDEGFKRLGCIGCPMGSVKQRRFEFERYPKYKNLYLLAFQKMIEIHGGGQTIAKTQKTGCTGTLTRDFQNMTADEWMEWWIY